MGIFNVYAIQHWRVYCESCYTTATVLKHSIGTDYVWLNVCTCTIDTRGIKADKNSGCYVSNGISCTYLRV